jgi:transposase InsO family protein
MILDHLDEAVTAGARQWTAGELLGLDSRTLQRWRARGGGEDLRQGPKTSPGNKLSDAERGRVLETVNSPEFRDLSPKQIVPTLADREQYLASESTIYRILRQEQQLVHRESYRAPTRRHKPQEQVATAPNQVWSWDITYLKSPVRGIFWYLYMVEDVWSRKIVGYEVHTEESSEHAAALVAAACRREGVSQGSLVIHMDNGGPMKGATLLATLERLGVAPSYSRPSVSNDNPYSESLFRTMKYRSAYPTGPFPSFEAARRWVADFVAWYNGEHLHSAIRFVTPAERHAGRDAEILAQRQTVYAAAQARNPERWSRGTRNWTPVEEVKLNPESTPVQQIA